jgi:hypothetical protein
MWSVPIASSFDHSSQDSEGEGEGEIDSANYDEKQPVVRVGSIELSALDRTIRFNPVSKAETGFPAEFPD